MGRAPIRDIGKVRTVEALHCVPSGRDHHADGHLRPGAIVPDDIPQAINTKHLCCITLNQERCLPVFLHGAFLFHPHVRQQLGAATKGAIMEGLNMEIIKGLRIPLPPLSLQQRFAYLVREHERLRAMQRESLRQAEHLFQSLLQRAFGAGG